MAGSPMHGYQQLGVFGAVGVLFSAAFALLVLPLLVPIPKQSGQAPLWLTRAMEGFHGWGSRGRPLAAGRGGCIDGGGGFRRPAITF